MESADDLKKLVREKYAEIAVRNDCGCSTSCCGVAETSSVDFTIFADDYSQLDGYNPAADLKLGCGTPTEFAEIKPGDTVVDLGSGAGNDAFVARTLTGSTGRVIGVDMTPEMIDKARANAKNLKAENIEFRLGEIEALPLGDNGVDVVISNCVLNLVPDKERAFREIFRVLKPGGHFSISDVVLAMPLPEGLTKAAEMYAGCVAGALLRSEYLAMIADHGFTEIRIQSEKPISVPEDVLAKYLDADEVRKLQSSGSAIASLTVYAQKPLS